MLKVTGFEGSSGGPGGDEHVRMSVWLWPLPPPGPAVTVTCSWPGRGLQDASIVAGRRRDPGRRQPGPAVLDLSRRLSKPSCLPRISAQAAGRLLIEVDDEAVAEVGESGAYGHGERGGAGPPGAVLHDRPLAKGFPGRRGHDCPRQSPAAGPRMGEHADGRHRTPCTQAGDGQQGTGIQVAERGQAAGPAFRRLCRRRLGVQAGEQPQVGGSQGRTARLDTAGRLLAVAYPYQAGPRTRPAPRPGSAARRLASSTPAPWASSCGLRRTGKVAAGPYTTGAAAPGTVSTPR